MLVTWVTDFGTILVKSYNTKDNVANKWSQIACDNTHFKEYDKRIWR
jgi:hypothetical protein